MRKLINGRSFQGEFREYNYLCPEVIRPNEAYSFRPVSSVNDTRFHRGFYRRRVAFCPSEQSVRNIKAAEIHENSNARSEAEYVRNRDAQPVYERATGKRMVDAAEIVSRIEKTNLKRALSGSCRFYYSSR